MRRLEEINLVRSSSVKNRKLYTLSASPGELDILEALFEPYEAALVAERAPVFEQGAASKLRWMDDTHEFFRQTKVKNAQPS